MKKIAVIALALIALACIVGGFPLGQMTAIVLVASLFIWVGGRVIKRSEWDLEIMVGTYLIIIGLYMINVARTDLADPVIRARIHLRLHATKMAFHRRHEVTSESLTKHRREIAMTAKHLARLDEFEAKAVALEKEYGQGLKWDVGQLGEERRHCKDVIANARRSFTNDVELMLWRALAFTGSRELYEQGKVELLKGI